MSRALTVKLGLVIGAAIVAAPAAAQDGTARVLFTNVRVFNGLDDRLLDADVLVEDNMIVEVGRIDAPANARIIDGGGRTLMPGLIDSHVHFNMNAGLTIPELQQKTWEEIGARAAYAAQEHFASGFTTVRDMCAMHDGLKKTIDAGYLVGPRIYLAGACIGQTGGHGDWGNLNQPKGTSYLEQLEFTRMVDGRAEVMAGVRRNFALGAHYVKIMVSGGVTSEKRSLTRSGRAGAGLRMTCRRALGADSTIGRSEIAFDEHSHGRRPDRVQNRTAP